MILFATSSLNSLCHSAKFSLLFRILATISAPCIGGLEYIFLAMILQLIIKLLDLRKDLFSGVLVWGNNMKSTNSFSVESDVFCKRLWDNHLESFLDEVSDGPSILFEVTGGESLISRIEEGNQRILLHHSTDLLPLLLRRINTSRVVRTCMQQHNWPRHSSLQKLDHGLKVESLGLGVIVWILNPLQSCVLDDVLVVEPGGVRDVHPAGEVLAEEGETEAQGAGTWDSLASGDAALFDGDAIGAEE